MSQQEELNVEPSDIYAVARTESESDSNDQEALVETRSKRVVRRPKWLRDYVSALSVCRTMNTKKTPRKRATCPNCKKDVKLEDYIKHVQEYRQARAPTVITCSVCKAPFSKQAYMRKHMRKFQTAAETTTQASVKSESSCETSCNSKENKSNEWDRDPEIEIDFALSSDSDDEECEKAAEATDDSLTIGLIERKRTTPDPVRAPMKKKVKSGPSTPMDNGDKKGQSGCDLVKDSVSKVGKGVQCSTLRCEHCKIDF